MNLAWSLYRKYYYSTFGEALKEAWVTVKRELLREALRVSYVWLKFRKVDGVVTIRKATLNASLIPQTYAPKNIQQIEEECKVIVKFYSETDNGWRCCRAENILSFSLA